MMTVEIRTKPVGNSCANMRPTRSISISVLKQHIVQDSTVAGCRRLTGGRSGAAGAGTEQKPQRGFITVGASSAGGLVLP